MTTDVKKNVKDIDVWIRGLFIVIFGVIFYFLLYPIIGLLVIFQFLMKVFTGKLNDNLSGFSVGLTNYAFQILNYITFQSEERPFPFSSWPAGSNNTPVDASDNTVPVADDATPPKEEDKTE